MTFVEFLRSSQKFYPSCKLDYRNFWDSLKANIRRILVFCFDLLKKSNFKWIFEILSKILSQFPLWREMEIFWVYDRAVVAPTYPIGAGIRSNVVQTVEFWSSVLTLLKKSNFQSVLVSIMKRNGNLAGYYDRAVVAPTYPFGAGIRSNVVPLSRINQNRKFW